MPSVFDDPNFCHPLSDPRCSIFSESTLRKALMDAIKIREESWIELPSRMACVGGGKYQISTEEAARQACLNHKLPFTLAPLIWLAISEYSSVSNDTLAWADGEYDSFFNRDGSFKEDHRFEIPPLDDEDFSNPPAAKEKKVVEVSVLTDWGSDEEDDQTPEIQDVGEMSEED